MYAIETLAATIQNEWSHPDITGVPPASESSQYHNSSFANDATASNLSADCSIGTARAGQSSGGCGRSANSVLAAVKQIKQRFLQIRLQAVEAQVLLQELRNGRLGRPLPPPLPLPLSANRTSGLTTTSPNSPRLASSTAVARVVPISATRVARPSCKRRFSPASETPDNVQMSIPQKDSLYALVTYSTGLSSIYT